MDNRKKVTLPELPPEILLFQILPKLPAKSLLRFKCVCKQWRSFLETPMFTRMHLHHVTTVDRHRRYENLLLFNTKLLSPQTFQTIDCEDGSISTPRCHPFAGTLVMPITYCVNGLACVGILKNLYEFSDMMLWNPLTGEYKKLSRPVDRQCYNMSTMALQLYYTSGGDDDYKILCVNTDRSIYIYSLKSDSWRKLESILEYHECIPDAGDHNLLDEKLHFLMRVATRHIIIRVDLKTEKLTKIELPHTCCCPDGCLSLMVVRGCIHLTIFNVDLYGTWTIEEWHMNGDGDWTKVVNSIYSTQEDPRPLYFTGKTHLSLANDVFSSFTRPLHLMRNGNWLLRTRDGICKLDPEKKTKDDLCSNPNIFIYPHGIYIETFVSPNQYIH